MKRILCVLAIMLMAVVGMRAITYSLFKTSNGVMVQNPNGISTRATVGMKLNLNDIMVIPKGGSISIADSFNNCTYKCDKAGRILVEKVISDAIHGQNDFPKSTTQTVGEIKYEKGAVTRDLDVYDLDSVALYVAARILQSKSDGMPVVLRYGPTERGGYSFRLENDMKSSVYFNVLKYKDGVVGVSPLGQPYGSYVLLPDNVLQREQLTPLQSDEVHVIVVTPFPFDIDSMIEKVNNYFPTGAQGARDDTAVCVLIFD